MFACLLSLRLTALRPTGYRDELRRFRPGLDYTVAHHGAMTVTARLDATLCFVDDDRISLLDENENQNEDSEHEKERKDKEENKPIEPDKKGSCCHLSVLWNTSPISFIEFERKGPWTDSVVLLVIIKLDKGRNYMKDKSDKEEEEEDEDDEDEDDGEGAWDNGDIGK